MRVFLRPGLGHKSGDGCMVGDVAEANVFLGDPLLLTFDRAFSGRTSASFSSAQF